MFSLIKNKTTQNWAVIRSKFLRGENRKSYKFKKTNEVQEVDVIAFNGEYRIFYLYYMKKYINI